MPDAVRNPCPNCGATLGGRSPAGLCPNCLLRTALESGAGALEDDRDIVSAFPRIRYFGDYELLEEIARGGMGVIYRARQVSLDRIVAVKMMRPGLLSSQEEVRRFREEARLAAALQHPNIVAIHEVGEHDGLYYFSMNYVDGMNLAEMVREQPLSEDQAAQYVKIIAEAIQYAHGKGTLHRDLKPSNVLIDVAGQLRITDFGLARPLQGESGLTMTGVVMGTPAYMAPEQARGKAGTLSVSSDVYSLGAVLFTLVTGQAPFQSASVVETLRLVLETEPRPPRGLNPELSRDLETICLKCLEKEPGKRYESARDLAAELERFLRGEPILARPLSPAGSLWRWRKRNPWPATAAAALTLLLIVTTMVLYRHFTQYAPQPWRPSKIIPLVTDRGSATRPSISPDGTRVAFVMKDIVFVKTIGVEGAMQLASGDSPAWSPDATRIAFVRTLSRNKTSVHVIPAQGGAEQTVGNVLMRTKLPTGGMGGYLAWAADGKGLIVSDGNPPGLILLSTTTGEKTRLTTSPASGVGDYSPALSPAGNEIVFVRRQGTAVSDLYRLRVQPGLRPRGEPERLTFFNRETGSPAWSSDGRTIFFATSESQRGRRLWRMAAHGKPSPEPVDAYGEGVMDVAVRGSRLVYSRHRNNPDIWAIDLHARPAARAGPLIASSELEMNPQYSPDGKRIAFQSNRSGAVEIWTCASDGAQCRQLTFLDAELSGHPQWSPDGKQIAFNSRPTGFANIFTVDATGGPVRKITEGPHEDLHPSWSTDGGFIYFDSDRSGEEEVWKVIAAGGHGTQVTRNGGVVPTQSPDGKFLFYVKDGEQGGLWRMPAAGGIETRVLPSVGGRLHYGLTSNGMYFFTRAEQDYTLQFLEFSKGVTTPVCGVRGPISYGLSVSPDGRRILYTQGAVGESSLILAEGIQ